LVLNATFSDVHVRLQTFIVLGSMTVETAAGPSRRTDTFHAACIETALVIARTDGVGSALDHMLNCGVPKLTALRVLSSPAHVRHHERRRYPRFHHR
jgi:hypothetical protein